MTALERAEQIVEELPPVLGDMKTWLVNAIHRACIEHSNAEMERRRKVEAKLAEARQALTIILAAVKPCDTDYGDHYVTAVAEAALKAMEGDDV